MPLANRDIVIKVRFSPEELAMLREKMERFRPIFAQPQYSTDNALGVAVLAWRETEK